jgi:hypothetical protein
MSADVALFLVASIVLCAILYRANRRQIARGKIALAKASGFRLETIDAAPGIELWRCVGLRARSSSSADALLVLICGNPGLPLLYNQLATRLAALSNGRLEVLVVGHVGHDNERLNRRSAAFTLDEQIEHKLAVIEQELSRRPASTRLFVAGHSVGAHILVQLHRRLADDPALARRVEPARTLLLCPTIANLADTPWARGLYSMLRFGRGPLAHLVGTLVGPLLPATLLRAHVAARAGRWRDTEYLAHALASLLAGHAAIHNWFELGWSEMLQIRSLDHDAVRRCEDRLSVFWSRTDGFAPLELFHTLSRAFPRAAWHLDVSGTDHSIVFAHSETAADWMWQQVRDQI